jgi:hypothetical protein
VKHSLICIDALFRSITVGKSWEGDIALDDITLNSGSCSSTIVCDFEHGPCDEWEKGSDGDFAWSRGRNGSTPSGTPTIGEYQRKYHYSTQ